MTDKGEQEKQVTKEGAVEVDEEKLDKAAGGADVFNAALTGQGKTVKIDFCKTDTSVDPSDPSATFTEKT